jgi:hypothetical protein
VLNLDLKDEINSSRVKENQSGVIFILQMLEREYKLTL